MTTSASTINPRNVKRPAHNVDKPIINERLAIDNNKRLTPPNNKRSTFHAGSICVSPGGPLTKKRFVSPVGGPKIDSSSIETDVLELAARKAVQSMFPVSHSYSLTETDYLDNVTQLVVRFMKKHANLPEQSTSPQLLATKVCKSLHDSFPQRSLFHLLQRWGRKKKYDFTKDALNTIVVLNSNLPSQPAVGEKPNHNSRNTDPLIQFLRKSRDFCIKPKFGQNPLCIGTQYLRNKNNCGIIVDRLEIAIGLMY